MNDDPIPFDDSNKSIDWEVLRGEKPTPSFDYILPFGELRKKRQPPPEKPPTPIKSDRLYGGQVKMRFNPDRFYLRGTSKLGLLNTLTGCLFNRVLSKEIDRDTGKVVRYRWRKATDFPPYKGE